MRAAERLDFDAAYQVYEAACQLAAEGEIDGDASGAAANWRGNVGELGLHLEQGLPRTPSFIFPEVLTNPIVEQCVARLLGPAFIRYYNGNTACPMSGSQPLHMDGGGWSVKSEEEARAANLSWPHPPMKLSVNFGVDAMLPSNGSTEVYLGSHTDLRAADGSLSAAEVGELLSAEGHGPTQVSVPKGGVVFRDLRVLHRGVPNHDSLPRHMMCVGYNAERDPGGNCSHMGQGKGDPPGHVFANDETTMSILQAPSDFPIDRNIRFVDAQAVDHFGNVLAPGESADGDDDTPYARGQRDRFWLPEGLLPAESEVVQAMPGWARQAAVEGKPLRRGDLPRL